MTKPMPPRKFEKHLKKVGWCLEKESIDWKLVDGEGMFLHSIKINHGKGHKHEVSSCSVHKVEKEFKDRGWAWPPV